LPEAVGAWRAATNRTPGKLWLYYAMLARALARSGDPQGAAEVAQQAASVASNDSVSVSRVTALQAAIEKRCYAARVENDSCPDPLSGWGLSPQRPPDVVPDPQNAKPSTS
jgi:hypothetical protein